MAVTAASGLLLTACGDGGGGVDLDDPTAQDTEDPGTDDPGTDGDTDAGEATADGTEGGTLVAAIGGEPDQLNPLTTTSSFAFTVLENVYDTLVQPGDDLTPEPALAESWETSDDLLTWVFTLREGVTFHDGSDFTADDVVASMEYIRDEGANGWRLEAVDAFEATDDYTVTVNLNRPAPNLLDQLGPFKGMAIVPSEQIDAGTLGDEVIGTGPFQLTSASADVLELEAYADYWGEGPYLDGIEFRIIPDEGVKLTNLETGEVDWIDSVPPEQVTDLEQMGEVEVGRVAGNDYWYMALNNEREPFDDPDVRRAIAFALDPVAIAEATNFDAATPNETAIPEGSFWYLDYAPFGHDPDQAQSLLDEAGVDGLSIDLMVTNEFPETVTAAQVIASQLGEVGVDVQIRTEDFTTWLAEQGEGNFDAFALGWLGNIDPDDFYYAQHHSEGVNNFQGFDDAEVDQLLDDARVEVDEEARKELYDQAAQRIVDQASYIYFYNPDIVEAWSPDVSGYVTRADSATRFVDTRLEE
ncbi:ABC transporter substrate-binding protein [Egicoccus halophilus]|uniref:ABC transporter substrate-binding protein n=1 Tax=Egicoccus halophilus TaxID=1670830 RepID=A0A8J3A5I8_9ACTN|nr:ABC transporter substrate-binding protein [Egicoccus halophilus]GGI03061.1 ABC transporter substrate-binding protein [Egicoccus halophilus]